MRVDRNTKLTVIFYLLGMFVLFLLVITIMAGVMIFRPNNVVEIKNAPFITNKQEYHLGERVEYGVEICKKK